MFVTTVEEEKKRASSNEQVLYHDFPRKYNASASAKRLEASVALSPTARVNTSIAFDK